MYIELPEEVCPDDTSGDLSNERNFVIRGYDAITITYLIVGLEIGEFPVKVVALTTVFSDVVVKMLKVVVR